jgi:hypothetical protein
MEGTMDDDKEPPRPSDLEFWLCEYQVGKISVTEEFDESDDGEIWITMFPTCVSLRGTHRLRGVPRIKRRLSDVEPLIRCGWHAGVALLPTHDVRDRVRTWWIHHEEVEREKVLRAKAKKAKEWPHAFEFFAPSAARKYLDD